VNKLRDRLRKGGRLLLWALPLLLAAYLLVMLADGLWYRTRFPVTFRDANWAGTWRTEGYGGLTGRVLVRMPDPIPADQDFQAEALVYYPVYSFWKTGQFVKMDFTGHFSPDQPASSGRSTNEIPGGSGGKLKFKGTAGNQVVEYSALMNEGHTRIVGGYLSHSPYDYGSFCISNP
jgi:hypothetical protein